MSGPPRAWVACTGEPLPVDAGTPRLLRAGMLCRHLEAAGYEVDFWTGNFDHARKAHRYPDTGLRTEQVSSRFRIRLLASRGYERNVSLGRILDHRDVARSFREAAPGLPRPDVLVLSMPTIDLAHAGARFAKDAGIPYVMDLRDLWPEIFYMERPAISRWMVRAAASVWSRQLNWSLRHADAIVGITEDYVHWGLARAGRERRVERDLALPLAYPPLGPESDREREERDRLVAAGVLRPDRFQIAFSGSLSLRADLATLCEAARTASRKGVPVHLVVAGNGEALDDLRARFESDAIRFLGWVDQNTLRALLRTSKVGVVPYRNTLDFRMSIPNKAIEYMSAGLPILTPLQGTLRALIERERTGKTYREADPGSLAGALESMAADRDGLLEMASNARSLFQARFSRDTVFQAYQQLIERIRRG